MLFEKIINFFDYFHQSRIINFPHSRSPANTGRRLPSSSDPSSSSQAHDLLAAAAAVVAQAQASALPVLSHIAANQANTIMLPNGRFKKPRGRPPRNKMWDSLNGGWVQASPEVLLRRQARLLDKKAEKKQKKSADERGGGACGGTALTRKRKKKVGCVREILNLKFEI